MMSVKTDDSNAFSLSGKEQEAKDEKEEVLFHTTKRCIDLDFYKSKYNHTNTHV